MAMYALALMPLSKHLQPMCKQVWYADDATGCDKLETMRRWFDELCKVRPQLRVFSQAREMHFGCQARQARAGKEGFSEPLECTCRRKGSKDTGVEIQQRRHASFGRVGNADFKQGYVNMKVNNWIKTIQAVSQSLPPRSHTPRSPPSRRACRVSGRFSHERCRELPICSNHSKKSSGTSFCPLY